MLLDSRQQLPSAADAEAELAALIPALNGANSARFLAIASFTMMVYDYFLTLDEEVESIAFRPHSFLSDVYSVMVDKILLDRAMVLNADIVLYGTVI